jgi:acetyl-CoA synthetase
MLACARIGAPFDHLRRVFGDRDRRPRQRRRPSSSSSRRTADTGAAGRPAQEGRRRALDKCPTVEKVLVVRSARQNARTMQSTAATCGGTSGAESRVGLSAPPKLDAEHPLYILYTSGSTGKPKGILHTTGGYMVGTATRRSTCSTCAKRTPTGARPTSAGSRGTATSSTAFFANGATRHVRRRAELSPDEGRFWEHRREVQSHVFYTAPTAIRTFEMGRRMARTSTTSSCACWAPSANRSIPRRGCGTTASSARSAAPSSTPGGRPKPGHHDHDAAGRYGDKTRLRGLPFFGVKAAIVTRKATKSTNCTAGCS